MIALFFSFRIRMIESFWFVCSNHQFYCPLSTDDDLNMQIQKFGKKKPSFFFCRKKKQSNPHNESYLHHMFLDVSSHLYKRVCPSVGCAVCMLVHPSRMLLSKSGEINIFEQIRLTIYASSHLSKMLHQSVSLSIHQSVCHSSYQYQWKSTFFTKAK